MPANAIAIVAQDTVEFIGQVFDEEQCADTAVPAGLEAAFLDKVCAEPGKTLGHVMRAAFEKDTTAVLSTNSDLGRMLKSMAEAVAPAKTPR